MKTLIELILLAVVILNLFTLSMMFVTKRMNDRTHNVPGCVPESKLERIIMRIAFIK